MFVMGGDVKGGQVYGKWPGLENHQLNEGRDLMLTTDFRTVVGEILAKHNGVKQLNAVFPGIRQQSSKVPEANAILGDQIPGFCSSSLQG